MSYDSEGNRSVVDHVLVRPGECTMIRDVKVTTYELCISQHKLMICIIDWKDKSPKHKKVFVSKCRIWKLKDADKRKEFKTKVQSRAMTQLIDDASVEDLWQDLKDCMLEVADEVCGKTKKPPRHKETWWWNDEVKLVVEEKSRLFNS